MKICQAVEEYAAIIGIHPLQPGETQPFNRRNVGVLLIFGLFFTSITKFLLYDAETLQQYNEVFHTWITLLCVYAGFLFYILNTNHIYRLIENMEKFIDDGKRLVLMKHSNRK